LQVDNNSVQSPKISGRTCSLSNTDALKIAIFTAAIPWRGNGINIRRRKSLIQNQHSVQTHVMLQNIMR